MAAVWDGQQALTDLEARLNLRFDRLEEGPVATARLDERVKVLETQAGWIGIGLFSALTGVVGLIFAAVKHQLGW